MRGSNSVGPHTLEQLAALASQGGLVRADMLLTDGSTDAVSAESLSILFPPLLESTSAARTGTVTLPESKLPEMIEQLASLSRRLKTSLARDEATAAAPDPATPAECTPATVECHEAEAEAIEPAVATSSPAGDRTEVLPPATLPDDANRQVESRSASWGYATWFTASACLALGLGIFAVGGSIYVNQLAKPNPWTPEMNHEEQEVNSKTQNGSSATPSHRR